MVGDFLQERLNGGASADTVRTYRAALRKVFGDPALAGNIQPSPRRKAAIARSRFPRGMDERLQVERWKDVIDLRVQPG